MQVFDIVLAFALLMVIFSSISSGITELLLRATNQRSRNLQHSISKFAADVLLPNCEDAIGNRTDLLGAERKSILAEINKELTKNPTVEDHMGADTGFSLPVRLFPAVAVIDKLSTEAFVQRLANTTAGAILAGEAEDARATRVMSLTLAFERYMATSAERYRKRATIAAMAVSIFFAGAANIQFVALVSHLRENPAAVESIIADGDEIVRQSRAAAVRDAAEDFEQSIDQLSNRLNTVREDYQLPIGWGPDAMKAGAFLWVLNVLISGLLIGLGAPFWYEVVKKVGQIRSVAGALNREARETVAESATASHGSGALERHQSHAALFETVARLKKPICVDDTPPPVG